SGAGNTAREAHAGASPFMEHGLEAPRPASLCARLLTRVSSVFALDQSGPRSSRQNLTAGLISRRGGKLPRIGGGTGVHTRKRLFLQALLLWAARVRRPSTIPSGC